MCESLTALLMTSVVAVVSCILQQQGPSNELDARVMRDVDGSALLLQDDFRPRAPGKRASAAIIDKGIEDDISVGEILNVVRDNRAIGKVRVLQASASSSVVRTVAGVLGGLHVDDVLTRPVASTLHPRLMWLSNDWGPQLSVDFSSDGRLIACTESKRIRVFSAHDGGFIAELPPSDYSYRDSAFAFGSYDLVIACLGGHLLRWSITDGSVTGHWQDGPGQNSWPSLAVAQHDNIAVVAHEGGDIIIRDASDWSTVSTFTPDHGFTLQVNQLGDDCVGITCDDAGIVGIVQSIDQSKLPDGRSKREYFERLWIWERQTGRVIRELPSFPDRHSITAFKLARRHPTVVCTTDRGQMVAWNWRTGEAVLSTRARKPLAIAPDGRYVAAVQIIMEDNRTRSVDRVVVWDLRTGEPVFRSEALEDGSVLDPTALEFGPDGSVLVLASEHGIQEWQTHDWQHRIIIDRSNGTSIEQLIMSASGRPMFLNGGRRLIWELGDRRRHTVTLPEGWIRWHQSLANDKQVLLSGVGMRPAIVNLKGNECRPLQDARGQPMERPTNGRASLHSSGAWCIVSYSGITIMNGERMIERPFLDDLDAEWRTNNRLAELDFIDVEDFEVEWSPDGDVFFAADGRGLVRAWHRNGDEANAPYVLEHSASDGQVAIHVDQGLIAYYSVGRMQIADLASGTNIWKHEVMHPAAGLPGSLVTFSHDGTILAGTCGSTIDLLDSKSGGHLSSLQLSGPISDIAFGTMRGHLWVVVGKIAQLWDWEEGQLLAGVSCRPDGQWFIVSRDGGFDASQLDALDDFHWVFPDDPLRALPPEVFVRDYFQPGLLLQILGSTAGQLENAIRPWKSLQELNRAQPAIEILDVVASKDERDVAIICVRVQETSYVSQSGRTWETGPYDLRLFRDGKLVARCPEPTTDRLEPSEGSTEEALASWRRISHVSVDNDSRVKLQSDGSAVVRFSVRLPRLTSQPISFTAYAFNSDRVRSAMATRVWSRLAESVSPGNLVDH